eukprot:CAMPEP_0172645088 /NCGR_PEP_ID=MMETSP1068-20121228/239547_1 /TAXON_ID=35684 /ORGANISM="Pseudopedinella elastica, Strain CCMP716" /LENGTH=306 /DNA_ID=CAMNT_0013459313 /DNA_START=96 /DNA_END=1016 /DNA_ORIENTATION=-
MSRSAVAFFLLLTGAARSKLAPEFEAAPLTDEEKAKGLTQQVRQLSNSWFSFGSTIADEIDGEAEAYAALEKEEQQSGQRHYRRDGNRAATWARIKPFAIDITAVTNSQFQAFVRATKYKTEAEAFQWSFVLEALVKDAQVVAEVDGPTGYGRVKDAPHWMAVKGAYWRRPEGPGSSLRGRGGHPAVHISYKDAEAYCAWAGGGRRLPTEKEWEMAARGGLEDEPFPWGSQAAKAHERCNGWTGDFTKEGNDQADGWVGTAPVDAYEPNAYGIYNMVGTRLLLPLSLSLPLSLFACACRKSREAIG